MIGPRSPSLHRTCWPSEDVVIPPANMQALARRWPGAQLELFSGGGHAFMAQEPARLASVIKGFVGS